MRQPKRPKWRRKLNRIARRITRRTGILVQWMQETQTMRYRLAVTLPGAIHGPIVITGAVLP